MAINFRSWQGSEQSTIEQLFRQTFANSEGAAEGEIVAGLVQKMMGSTPPADIYGFVAEDQSRLVGCIFFTRITFDDDLDLFILSPVAVATDCQGTGVGQALIKFGIAELRSKDVAGLFTYGDPAFYSRVGFQSVTEDQVKAPFPLSQPIGWLYQGLKNISPESLRGTPVCVSALSKPEYW